MGADFKSLTMAEYLQVGTVWGGGLCGYRVPFHLGPTPHSPRLPVPSYDADHLMHLVHISYFLASLNPVCPAPSMQLYMTPVNAALYGKAMRAINTGSSRSR